MSLACVVGSSYRKGRGWCCQKTSIRCTLLHRGRRRGTIYCYSGTYEGSETLSKGGYLCKAHPPHSSVTGMRGRGEGGGEDEGNSPSARSSSREHTHASGGSGSTRDQPSRGQGISHIEGEEQGGEGSPTLAALFIEGPRARLRRLGIAKRTSVE